MTSPTDTLTLLTVPATSASTGISIGLQQHQGVALTDLIALVHHDLEHTGHDLGANILGHFHPFRLLHAALSNHNARGSEQSQRHETLVGKYNQMEEPMAKRGRKKRDRKHSKANHGKRPNS